MGFTTSPPRTLVHRLALGLVIVAVLAVLSGAPVSAAPPPSVVDAASADLAERTDSLPGDIVVLRDAAVTWNDGCLGAAEPGEFCTQALVDGFVLWLGLADAAYRYHTDIAQTVRLAAGPFPLQQVAGAPLPGGATPRAPGFVGDLPPEGGVVLGTWQGGSAADLVEAVPGAISFWVTAEGRFFGYIPGAPAFVNSAFLSLYPDDHIAGSTHMLVVMPRVAGVDFDRTGNVVFDTPGLPAGLWHLVYEEVGAPALTVSLTFTADSQCLLPTGAAFLCDELEVGTRARVVGHLVAEDAVRVVRLQVIELTTIDAVVHFVDEDRYAVGEPPFTVAVPRQLSAPPASTRALEALFAGPTPLEHADSLRLVASGATGARVLQIADGIAHVELLGGCDSMGGTFTVANLITPTLTQFEGIEWVKIYDPEGATGEPTGPVDSIPACLEP